MVVLKTRDFLPVKEVVYANMLALENGEVLGEIFNIGSGKPTKIIELSNIINEIAGVTIPPKYLPPREGDIMHSVADITKAETLLGFKPKSDLWSDLKDVFEVAKKNLETSDKES